MVPTQLSFTWSQLDIVLMHWPNIKSTWLSPILLDPTWTRLSQTQPYIGLT